MALVKVKILESRAGEKEYLAGQEIEMERGKALFAQLNGWAIIIQDNGPAKVAPSATGRVSGPAVRRTRKKKA